MCLNWLECESQGLDLLVRYYITNHPLHFYTYFPSSISTAGFSQLNVTPNVTFAKFCETYVSERPALAVISGTFVSPGQGVGTAPRPGCQNTPSPHPGGVTGVIRLGQLSVTFNNLSFIGTVFYVMEVLFICDCLYL